MPHRFAHRAQMHRDMRRVGDQPAVGREDRAAEIEPLLHVHAARRVAERDAHLLGDAGELVVEDFEQDGVGGIADIRVAACRLLRICGLERRSSCSLSVSSNSPPRQHLGLPARIDDRRRDLFADDRRAGDAIAGDEFAAIEERARRCQLAVEVGGRAFRAESGCVRSRASLVRSCACHAADDFDARRDDFQRPVLVRVAVELRDERPQTRRRNRRPAARRIVR